MKILFLDIDGVLNSAKFFAARKEEREWDAQVERFQSADPTDFDFWATTMLDIEAVDLLNNFVLATADLYIVISSSWREVHPLSRIKLIFEMAGSLPGKSKIAERIIDRTDIGGPRQDVILGWVQRFHGEIDAWAILDDMPLPGMNDVHVKTSWARGLDSSHIEALRTILDTEPDT